MIAVITYNHPHRKTQDLVFRLLAYNYDVCLVVIPWQDRKNFKPLYQHRPLKPLDLTPLQLKQNLGLVEVNYYEVKDLSYYFDKYKHNHILIGGAGLLPGLDKYNIINSHPGILPYSRGLDAYKWAIYNKMPVGATTHFISDELDAGEVILQKHIDIKFNDTFDSVAQRLYELEIDLMIESIDYLDKGGKTFKLTSADLKIYEPMKRMPHYIEQVMMYRFSELSNSRNC